MANNEKKLFSTAKLKEKYAEVKFDAGSGAVGVVRAPYDKNKEATAFIVEKGKKSMVKKTENPLKKMSLEKFTREPPKDVRGEKRVILKERNVQGKQSYIHVSTKYNKKGFSIPVDTNTSLPAFHPKYKKGKLEGYRQQRADVIKTELTKKKINFGMDENEKAKHRLINKLLRPLKRAERYL